MTMCRHCVGELVRFLEPLVQFAVRRFALGDSSPDADSLPGGEIWAVFAGVVQNPAVEVWRGRSDYDSVTASGSGSGSSNSEWYTTGCGVR